MLIDNKTNVLVQGMTGKEGTRAALAMLEYGTNVACGVTPGKGGQMLRFADGDQVWERPIFNTVAEAIEAFPDINTTAIYVPPKFAKDAVLEAIRAGIRTVNIMTERIPIRDTAEFLAEARERSARVVGPSSLGYIVPGVGRVGVVGGPKQQADEIFCPGSVGIISRSGGMTNELAWQVRRSGCGQSMVVHVGGDLLMGTTYADLLRDFEADPKTKAVVIFGEHGGRYEFDVVRMIERGEFTKPLAVYVGGKFANVLPAGVQIGHAGAIVARGEGAADKEKAFAKAGAMIAGTPEELVALVRPYALEN